ncbi:hypothetical protein V6N12_066994 [Hibiscus sabdariffa]|uniref:DUF4283 domain-containing protein n=1 Tax=Hibiscus sabdariffa TaxID=183260 RepID=A0ABR2BKI9_9ROSI
MGLHTSLNIDDGSDKFKLWSLMVTSELDVKKEKFRFLFGPWLKVEAASLNSHIVRELKPDIVFTKHVGQPGASKEGTIEARASNMEHGKAVAIGSSNPKHSKRSHVRKDGEGSLLVTKKARLVAVKLGVDVGQEETSPLLMLTSMGAAKQPRRG